VSARKITVSVECCDFETGEMQVVAEDPDNPEQDFRYQQMILHPAVCSLLHTLLGHHVADGRGHEQSISLNAQPEGTPS
jgi:hypothetical protein